MRILIQIAALALLTGCWNTTTGPQTGAPVESVLGERGQLARASVQAARSANALPASEETRAVVDLELQVAEWFLPMPTGSQSGAAQSRAERALSAGTQEQRAALYRDLQTWATRLQAQLDAARIEEAKRAEAESGRREALLMQTRIFTYAGIGFIALGVGLSLTSNPRMGIMALAVGGALSLASRFIATVPDWVYVVLTLTFAVLIMVGMVWAFRAGLFQHPPKRVGEYEVET